MGLRATSVLHSCAVGFLRRQKVLLSTGHVDAAGAEEGNEELDHVPRFFSQTASLWWGSPFTKGFLRGAFSFDRISPLGRNRGVLGLMLGLVL